MFAALMCAFLEKMLSACIYVIWVYYGSFRTYFFLLDVSACLKKPQKTMYTLRESADPHFFPGCTHRCTPSLDIHVHTHQVFYCSISLSNLIILEWNRERDLLKLVHNTTLHNALCCVLVFHHYCSYFGAFCYCQPYF